MAFNNDKETDLNPTSSDNVDTGTNEAPQTAPEETPAASEVRSELGETTMEKASSSSSTAIVVGVVVASALVAAGIWYFVGSNSGDLSLQNGTGASTQQPGSFDELFNTPADDEVVATVNGAEITGNVFTQQLQQVAGQAQQFGADISTEASQNDIIEQTFSTLENTELLLQAAAAQGVSVDDAAVSERLTQVEAEVGGAEALEELLVDNNLSEDELRDTLRKDLVLSAYIEQSAPASSFVASEEEARALYDQVAGSGQQVPDFSEVQPQIEAQIQQQKQQEAIAAIIEGLREAADIERLWGNS